MSHGKTRRKSQIVPGSGRSALSQCAERPTIETVSAARPTTIKISGPLSRMPAASAVQKTAANGQLSGPARALIRLAPRLQIRAREHPHGDDDGEQQHRIGLGKASLDVQQYGAGHHQSGQDGAAPRNECQCTPIGRQHRANRTEKGRHPVKPNRGARSAQSRALRPNSPRPPAANRCRSVCGNAHRPGSGCRRSRRFRSFVWWLGRNRPRRDPPAESERSLAGSRAATRQQERRRRAGARTRQSQAAPPSHWPASRVAPPRCWSLSFDAAVEMRPDNSEKPVARKAPRRALVQPAIIWLLIIGPPAAKSWPTCRHRFAQGCCPSIPSSRSP